MGPRKKSSALAALAAITEKKGKRQRRSKSGGGKRKLGRYSRHLSSMRYKAEKRWLKNRVKRIERHLKRHPKDAQARRALGVAAEAAA